MSKLVTFLASSALALTSAALMNSPAAAQVQISELAPLTKPVTSFGAAAMDGALYVYGGHLGSPHEYSAEMQARQVLRLNLQGPDKWEVVGEGPGRTGLGLVAYGGSLYRVGGWEAKNAGGEKWQLHSTSDLARFDPRTNTWHHLAPMPVGRSSHDAAMLGSKLYVVGGWRLAGEGDGEWHDTAYVCDLAAAEPQWKEIAKPSFKRRALAVATYAGKVYVIGGMDDSNETTTGSDVYDPATDSWSKGPALPGEKAEGFGAAAVGCDAGLYVSTRSGGIFRLADDGKSWNEFGQLKHPRYFHRLVADGERRIVVVGGTTRGGKVPEVEEIRLAARGK
jgi:N-acetylneuraminic acid mutarotase